LGLPAAIATDRRKFDPEDRAAAFAPGILDAPKCGRRLGQTGCGADQRLLDGVAKQDVAGPPRSFLRDDVSLFSTF
jgi:hypothetical protein